MHRIVIVGGGAGGLELATRLGRKLGRRGKADVTLIDRGHTHVWKPLLHEVAAGSLDSSIDEVSYLAHGKRQGYHFTLGALGGLDRVEREVILEPLVDEDGVEILPERRVPYDYLIIAVGSVSNDFSTPGVHEHCTLLDSLPEAEQFQHHLLDAFLRLDEQAKADPGARLGIAIVGAGATGVELSAELYNAILQLHMYGLHELGKEKLDITLIEASDRILSALPENIANAAKIELEKFGVRILTSTQIIEATDEGYLTKDGQRIDADLRVWAAGVTGAPVIAKLSDLEISRSNQLVVLPTLQTSRDERILAIGDCGYLMQETGRPVPPRAQSAHQMATTAAKNISALLDNKPLRDYVYRDRGTLVSFSTFSAVGNLMGNLSGGSMKVEGRVARIMYISLYRMHQLTLHGWIHTTLIMLVSRLNRTLRPRLKLH
ncbi:MAG: NAD(P)/FAD-dependent oxidoreductase [Pseudomonadota bacterium]